MVLSPYSFNRFQGFIHRSLVGAICSHSVNEVRSALVRISQQIRRKGYNIPLVSHDIDLRFTLTLHPMITLPALALLVLNAKTNGRQDASSEQEEHEIREDDTMARAIVGCVLLAIDIAAYDAIQVSPAVNHCQLQHLYNLLSVHTR